MEKTFLVFTCMFKWHYLNALFTVEVPQSSYTVQTGSMVALECRFPVEDTIRVEELMIKWLHDGPSQTDQREVYVYEKGLEDLSKQETSYRGRATLLKDQLSTGRAVLQISNVKLTDKGTYSCIIGYGGADYKHIDLIVEAPYRKINKKVKVIQKDSGYEAREVTCQSEGYPTADVIWQSGGRDLSEKANTSYAIRSDQLHILTSVLQIEGGLNDSVRCIFWNKELQQNTTETFIIPEADLMLLRKRRGHFGAMLSGIFIVIILLMFAGWSQVHGGDPKDGAIRGHGREHIATSPVACSAEVISEVEADVHCDQRMALEKILV